ncbi:MAG: T9SS type A sorting domain-containing protein [Saprospiraceae bacterium]|nr:T9SS type A sorting domain-containing protein [Saprospiraceae bacterium]
MKLYFFALVALATPSLFAQPSIEWQFRYGGTGDEQVTAIRQTADGGYIAIGHSWSKDGDVGNHHGNNDKYDVWVVKLDAQGGLQWQNSYGGTNWDYGGDILQTPDGGYVFVGAVDSHDGDVSSFSGSRANWIVRLSPTGAIVWEKPIPGFLPTGKSVVALENGNFVVAASSNDSYHIFEIDASGETILWENSFGGSKQESLGSMARTQDKGFIMTGSSWSNDGDVSGHHGTTEFGDYWVVKVDSVGELLWQKSLGGTYLEQSYRIIGTSDGGSLVSGFSYSNDGDVSGSHGAVGSSSDGWVVKLNSDGDVTWQKCLGGTSSNDVFPTMFETPDGNFVLGGLVISHDGDVDTTQLEGGGDCWIVTLNPQGSIIAQLVIGGSEFDQINCIIPCTDGGMIFGGYAGSSDGDLNSAPLSFYSDYWFVKLGAVSATEETASNSLQISPNPGSSVLYLESPEADPLTQLTIVNQAGSLIHQASYTPGEFIDVSRVPKGVYWVTAESKSGKKRISKWIKQ